VASARQCATPRPVTAARTERPGPLAVPSTSSCPSSRDFTDPEKPVSIITIGLSRIAKATGGFSILARKPGDMSALFKKAMAARFS
jgi:hypothetical protein